MDLSGYTRPLSYLRIGRIIHGTPSFRCLLYSNYLGMLSGQRQTFTVLCQEISHGKFIPRGTPWITGCTSFTTQLRPNISCLNRVSQNIFRLHRCSPHRQVPSKVKTPTHTRPFGHTQNDINTRTRNCLFTYIPSRESTPR